MVEKISKDMTIGEIVQKHPESAEIMLDHGLHCVGCHVASWETLEQGGQGHGMTNKEIEELVDEINEVIEEE